MKASRVESARLSRATVAEGAAHIGERDARMRRWIERIGPTPPRQQRHQFGALCRAIVSQQISARAARTVHARFRDLFEGSRPSPEALLSIPDRKLRACGLSGRKLSYLRSLAQAFHSGHLSRVRLGSLGDEEVIEQLTRVPGVGVWTAEMFLIFALGRPDVFSPRDQALLAGLARVAQKTLTSTEAQTITSRWSPYRSVGSLYLWRIAHWTEHRDEGS